MDDKQKVMISQPMKNKTENEIINTRNKAVEFLEKNDYKVINTLFTDEWYSNEKMNERGVVKIPLCFLAKSLENMANCHTVYFCKGWEDTRGCKIEHEVAKQYDIEIIYEV